MVVWPNLEAQQDSRCLEVLKRPRTQMTKMGGSGSEDGFWGFQRVSEHENIDRP